MKRFAELYRALDSTTKRLQKRAALVDYFTSVPPEDAAWALYLLSGKKLMRALPSKRLRQWAGEEADLPPWMVQECYDVVGDLSETLALILPHPGSGLDEPLHKVIEQRLLPIGQLDEDTQRDSIVATWHACDQWQRFVFHKLISGAFRVGAARNTVIEALAEAAEVPVNVMAHRLLRDLKPTAEHFAALCAAEDAAHSPSQPYPFYLASPLDVAPESLGDIAEWQIEWKWDGIRCQLIKRSPEPFLWSRGEELVNEQFPELVQAATTLDAVVLDGEILAWEDGRPLSFHLLQRRLNRKRVEPRLFQDVPVVFMAYDLLEQDGEDLREWPLTERRERLSQLIEQTHEPLLQVSTAFSPADWDTVAALRSHSAEELTEGVMLKRRDSAYGVGRKRGAWWKLKREPYAIDAVLTAAQRGTGKRATLFTDYTFSVWNDRELVTIAKAYSGLDDAEIRAVDRFVRANTLETRGPVRIVKPELVFELSFDGLRPSSRHRSGIALRFPRMTRQRTDKSPAEADTLVDVQRLLQKAGGER